MTSVTPTDMGDQGQEKPSIPEPDIEDATTQEISEQLSSSEQPTPQHSRVSSSTYTQVTAPPPPVERTQRIQYPMEKFFSQNHGIEFDASVMSTMTPPNFQILTTSSNCEASTHLVRVPAVHVLGSGHIYTPPYSLQWEQKLEHYLKYQPPVLALTVKMFIHVAWGRPSRFYHYLASMNLLHMTEDGRIIPNLDNRTAGPAVFEPEELAELEGTSAAGLADIEFLKGVFTSYVLPLSKKLIELENDAMAHQADLDAENSAQNSPASHDSSSHGARNRNFWVPCEFRPLLWSFDLFRICLSVVLSRSLWFPHVSGDDDELPRLAVDRGSAAIPYLTALDPEVDDFVLNDTLSGVEPQGNLKIRGGFSTPCSWQRILAPVHYTKECRMTSPASRGRLVLIPFMDIVERRYFRLDTNDRQMHMNNSSHLGYAPGKGPWRPAFPVYTEGSMWLVPDRHEPDERGVMRESIRVTERELAQLCTAAAQSDETEYRDRRSRNSSSASSFETLTLPRGYSLRKFTPAFSLMTERFMCSGSQVCINQGGLPSSALLLCYGHASCLEVNVKTNSFEESERASNLNDVIDISVGLVEDAVISFLRTAGSTAIAYELLHRPLYSAPESLSPRARFRTDKLVNGGSSAAGKGCVPPNWVPGMLPLPHELDLPPYVLPMPGEPMDVRGAWKNVAERERRRLEVEKGKEKAEFDVRLYEKARKLLVDYGLMPPAMDDEVDNPGESFFHLPLKDMTPDRLFTTIRVLLMSHTEFEVYEREPKMLKAHYFISSDSDSDTGGEDVLSEKTRMAKVLSHMKRSNAAEPPIHGVDDDEVMSDVSDYDDFEWNPPRATSPIGTWEPDGLTIRLKDGALIPAECLDINDLPPKTHVSNLPLPPILTQPQLPQPEQPLQTPQLFEPYHYPQTPPLFATPVFAPSAEAVAAAAARSLAKASHLRSRRHRSIIYGSYLAVMVSIVERRLMMFPDPPILARVHADGSSSPATKMSSLDKNVAEDRFWMAYEADVNYYFALDEVLNERKVGFVPVLVRAGEEEAGSGNLLRRKEMNDDEESGDEGGSDEVDERDRESAGSESSVKRRRKSDEEEGVDLTLLSVKGEDSRISMNIAQAEGVEIDDEKPHVETSASTIETDEIQPIKVSDGGSFTVVSADPVNLSNATSILSSPPAASPTHDSIAVAAEPERSHIVSQLPPLPDSPVTKKESKYRLTYVQATRQKVAAVYLRVKERRGLVEYRQRLKLALDEEGRKVWGIV